MEKGHSSPDEYILHPAEPRQRVEMDLSFPARLYWLEDMEPRSTYEVRVAYVGTARVRVHLTPAGVFFDKSGGILHILDHHGRTVKLSDKYQTELTDFGADGHLVKHTGGAGLRGMRGAAGGTGPGGGGPGAGAELPPGGRGAGRRLLDVEKVVFETDGRGGIRGGRAAMIMLAERDGVHYTGGALPAQVVYDITLMQMVRIPFSSLPRDTFGLVLGIVATVALVVALLPRWRDAALPALASYVLTGGPGASHMPVLARRPQLDHRSL